MGENATERSSDISRGLYTLQARQLLDVIDRIRDVKGELTELELPRIAVIGKQSAGKSSLIEAVARYNVPRGAGTCTRCPTEMRLRCTDQPWKCSISLRLDYDEHGNKSQDKIEPVPFGESFDDPALVEVMLRRAQLAVLDPDNHPGLYLHVDPDMCIIPDAQLKFSKNVICIEISGPGLADLTLVDLPGMIQNDASKGNLDDLIVSMVREYISNKSTLILVAVTMNDDPENQAALKEARDADPDGTRTIGVLTKPDTVQDGEEHLWVPLLQNEGPHALELGYFVVKQRSIRQLENRTTFDAARQSEADFFRTKEPWNALSEDLQERLGTPNLTARLSTLLIDLIRALLPGLIDKIHSSLESVYDDLSLMEPELSDNPVGEMIRLVEKFSSSVRGSLMGSPGSKAFVRMNKKLFGDFKLAVRRTAPLFLPYTTGEAKLNVGPTVYTEPTCVAEDFAEFDKLKPMNLDEVRDIIEQEMSVELPFNVPFESKASLMLVPVQTWGPLIKDCFEKVYPGALAVAHTATIAVFGRFDQGPLLSKVQTIISREVTARVRETRAALEELLQMESSPMTHNTTYFTSVRGDLLTHYHHTRRMRLKEDVRHRINRDLEATPVYSKPAVKSEHHSQLIGQVLGVLAQLGWEDVRESDLAKLHREDDWEEEIIVMAETRAYFQVAYKARRVIDAVPQIVNHVFIRSLAEGIQQALITGLGIDSREAYNRCSAHLAENPAVTRKRKMLCDRRDRLEKAKEALSIIGY
ncbi:hypothetical protein CALCODRAFT_447877 [Calocera cornea HHB12733]|uniref:P-loop containing nucleoside triphosphate hydrolase protein n=1 Tax=Calocera cornea HHB12733 TaxID=1353952 RepID=A0A165IVI7_9BASI|nr:hypothetical protein CALCODRAFT_447877 [Calocera cornea HHB12733]